jgi:hypothetical protein
MKAVEVPERAQVSFLYNIFSVRVIACQPAGQIVSRSQVWQRIFLQNCE